MNHYLWGWHLRGTAKDRKRIRAYTSNVVRILFRGHGARGICMRDISRRTRISRIEGFVDDFRGISRRPSRRKAIGVPADMFTIAAGSPPEQSRARIPLDPLLRGTASRGREDGRERTEIRGRRHGERCEAC